MPHDSGTYNKRVVVVPAFVADYNKNELTNEKIYVVVVPAFVADYNKTKPFWDQNYVVVVLAFVADYNA